MLCISRSSLRALSSCLRIVPGLFQRNCLALPAKANSHTQQQKHILIVATVHGSGQTSIKKRESRTSSDSEHVIMQRLRAKDKHMVRLYVAGCFHHWELLPDIARDFVAAGCSAEELRGCVRHLIVFAGYGACLAATLTLHKAKLMPEDTPAKFGGPPGNAFELVYDSVTDVVRKKMHAADPAVGEWIRLHLYGDLYSSPGLDLRQKQLLACSFLGVAHMPDQLFGHSIAAMRFGNSKDEVREAVELGFQMTPSSSSSHKEEALKILNMAYAKYMKDYADQHNPPMVTIPDTSYIKVPELPPLYNTPTPSTRVAQPEVQKAEHPDVMASGSCSREGQQGTKGSSNQGRGLWQEEGDCDDHGDSDVLFAWEEIDPRFDQCSKKWRKQPQMINNSKGAKPLC